MVGYYLNTLPLVAPVLADDSLTDVARRWSNLVGQALAHRTYPYAEMVADRRRNGRPAPSVSVMLAFEELAPAKLGTLVAEHEVLATGSAVTDATFFVQARGQLVTLGLEYAGGFLDQPSAERLLEELDAAISVVLNQPTAAVASLATVPEKVQAAWNDTAQPLSPDQTVQAAFERHAAATPDAPAVIFEDQILTYANLERRANIVANQLIGRGVEAGHRIGVVARRHPDTVVGALAILKAGAAFVPCDPEYPAERLDQITTDADLQLRLDHADLFDDGSVDPGQPDVELSDQQLAYLIFTSGSTGRPKGVMVSHRNITESTAARNTVYPGPVGRFLLLSSFAFDSSMVGLFWSLSTGGALVLPDSGDHSDVGHLAELSERQQVTHLLALPSLYRLFLDEAEDNQLTSLDTVIVAGEACPKTLGPEHHRRCGKARLWNEYGPTEGTVWSHVYEVDAAVRDGSVPIGRPIPNMVGHVLDASGQLVDVGQQGELVLGGIGVTSGYVSRSDLTAAAFVRLTGPLDNGELHYRTGDLVRWLPTGDLEFLGRVDHQVKIRGYRIELGEIEAAALANPVVSEAVADAIDGRVEGQKQLALWVVATDALEGAELRKALGSHLPEFMVPNHVLVLDTLPRTPNGKVDRHALPDPRNLTSTGAGLSASEASVQPDEAEEPSEAQDGIEELLSEVWSDVLGQESVGRTDDFFDLGGDSIMSIQIVSRLRRHGWKVSTREVFEHPTIAQLATLAVPLDRHQTTPSGEQGVLSGPLPMLPIHRWLLAQPLTNRDHWNQSRWIDLAADVDVPRLLDAASSLPEQHDALRLRLSPTGLHFADSDSDSPASDSETLHRRLVANADLDQRIAVAEEAESSLDLAVGPLMSVVGFPAHDGLCAQVFVSIHHLAIDAVSWTPLLEDWIAIYDDPSAALPTKTSSVRQWAAELERWAASPEFEGERACWSPLADESRPTAAGFLESQTELVTVYVDAPATAGEDHVLAALTHALGHPSAVIMVEGHGRETDLAPQVDLSRTVGWLTTHHPLAVAPEAEVGATLAAIRQHRSEVRFKGLGHGLSVESSAGQISVLLNYLGRAEESSAKSDSVFASVGPITAGVDQLNPRLHRLGVMARITAGQLVLVFDHHPGQTPYEEVQAIADNTVDLLRRLFESVPVGEAALDPVALDLVDFDASELGVLGDVLDGLDD